MMNTNPLKKLEVMGQSIWVDFLRRSAITSGEMQRWIDEDGVSGVTSNPAIFEKAIVDSHDYDDTIERLRSEGKTAAQIFDGMAIEDIQHTADLFLTTHQNTRGADGFVSLEVSPALAHDTEGAITEGRKLWQAVNRPNLMIKIPGTLEGLPAIQQLISEGINVNITLLFGLPRYEAVIDAYLTGLEIRAGQKQPLASIASVASFFLSRIDTLIDPMLEKISNGSDPEKAKVAKSIKGQVAIASAKVAYEIYQKSITGKRFLSLAEKGAHRQRLLWASTSTKNPAESDVKYVEALIGPDTVDTIPVETLNAYRDHGNPAPTLKEGLAEAHAVLSNLKSLGIDIDQVTQQLEDEGVDKFNQAYDKLMSRLSEKAAVPK